MLFKINFDVLINQKASNVKNREFMVQDSQPKQDDGMTAAISAEYLVLNGNSMSYQCCLKQGDLIETQSELFFTEQ